MHLKLGKLIENQMLNFQFNFHDNPRKKFPNSETHEMMNILYKMYHVFYLFAPETFRE